MDDFLGTSIQYSEYQIKLLEQEHADNQQKIVEDLISSGFLDSDYEDTTTDNESEASSSLEIKENNLTVTGSESPLIESVDDSKLNISPTSLRDDSSSSTSIEQELSSSPSSINNEDLALVLGSDISVVDESNVSNSESIDDASINNQIIMNHSQHNQPQYRQYRYRQYNDIDNDTEYKVQEYENENHYDSDDQIQEIQQFDIVTSKAIIRFMEVIFSDIKYLMILFILMIAMPHIIERAHIENDNDGMQQFYGGGIKYQSNGYHGQHGGCQQAQYQTEIHWTLDTATTTQPITNDEDDERDEYQNDDDVETNQKKQCLNTPHILRLDIMTTKLDKETREVRGHLLHREFKINPCNNNFNMNPKMRMRIPTEMPTLFMKIGAGIKTGPQMMRIFKETSVITNVGRHFTRSHGLYALVMAFVGIAGFAASNGIDEIITISS